MGPVLRHSKVWSEADAQSGECLDWVRHCSSCSNCPLQQLQLPNGSNPSQLKPRPQHPRMTLTHIASRPLRSSRAFISSSSTCVISRWLNHHPPASQPASPPSQGANTPNPGSCSGSPGLEVVVLGRVKPSTSNRLPVGHKTCTHMQQTVCHAHTENSLMQPPGGESMLSCLPLCLPCTRLPLEIRCPPVHVCRHSRAAC